MANVFIKRLRYNKLTTINCSLTYCTIRDIPNTLALIADHNLLKKCTQLNLDADFLRTMAANEGSHSGLTLPPHVCVLHQVWALPALHHLSKALGNHTTLQCLQPANALHPSIPPKALSQQCSGRHTIEVQRLQSGVHLQPFSNVLRSFCSNVIAC